MLIDFNILLLYLKMKILITLLVVTMVYAAVPGDKMDHVPVNYSSYPGLLT